MLSDAVPIGFDVVGWAGTGSDNIAGAGDPGVIHPGIEGMSDDDAVCLREGSCELRTIASDAFVAVGLKNDAEWPSWPGLP